MAADLPYTEDDIQRMLACHVHLGTKNCDFQMERYVWRRRQDGIHLIHLGKTLEKLKLAAQARAALEQKQKIRGGARSRRVFRVVFDLRTQEVAF